MKERQRLIVGNWKMNTTLNAAETLLQELKKNNSKSTVAIGICPPFTHLHLTTHLKNSPIKWGAQTLSEHENGAYTGEISATMLKELGCHYVIIGHSERRLYFKETDNHINQKIKQALKHTLTPILCVGETLEERETNKTLSVIQTQLEKGLKDINASHDIIIAYEPVWAIGTGKVATPKEAQDIHREIRRLLEKKWGIEKAETIQILYGGSMKAENAKELLSEPDIDGGLIGGASLEEKSFTALIKVAEEK